MRIIHLIIAVAVITLGCVVPAHAKAWRGIVPLRSTRADVERLLGSPQTGTRNIYKTGTETISVTYAETHCAYGWRVALDTVVSLMVSMKTPAKLSDFGLDESKYVKRKDSHLENVYYINEDEGINYTVELSQGSVTAVEYYWSATDSHLKCSLTPTVGLKPAPKSDKKLKTRPARKRKAHKVVATFVCPMHPDVTSSKAGLCHRCGMRLAARTQSSRGQPTSTVQAAKFPANQQANGIPDQTITGSARPWASLSIRERMLEMERLAPTYEYTCLMHPEIHEAQSGLCPKCGMSLVSVNPSVRGEYKLLLEPEPRLPRPGETVLLRFTISNPQTGERVKDYVINHEKLFHLFIVSQDMSEYQHVHPTMAADGTFSVETTLPRPAAYKLHADFFPVGGMPQIIHRELVTAGYRPVAARAPALIPDTTLVKTVDDMKITLELGGPLVAGALVPLTYRLADSVTGKPVRDLEPYLGAWGHTLILSADQSDYLHTHPSEMISNRVDRATVRGGPDVEFKAMFPAPAIYRIWTQFQRAGRITTVSFTLRVQS